MHSAHRDLESKYKRVLNDLSNAQKNVKILNDQMATKNTEITNLKTIKAENESRLLTFEEESSQLKRELGIKAR